MELVLPGFNGTYTFVCAVWSMSIALVAILAALGRRLHSIRMTLLSDENCPERKRLESSERNLSNLEVVIFVLIGVCFAVGLLAPIFSPVQQERRDAVDELFAGEYHAMLDTSQTNSILDGLHSDVPVDLGNVFFELDGNRLASIQCFVCISEGSDENSYFIRTYAASDGASEFIEVTPSNIGDFLETASNRELCEMAA